MLFFVTLVFDNNFQVARWISGRNDVTNDDVGVDNDVTNNHLGGQ